MKLTLLLTAFDTYSIFLIFIFLLIAIPIPTYSNSDHGIIMVLHKSNSMIRGDSSNSHHHQKGMSGEEQVGRELYPMGSSLPDCTHACGVCSPCKRVMVSFQCASESCPVVYRCLCHGKYYHVPSSK